jgi:hypothetical protein
MNFHNVDSVDIRRRRVSKYKPTVSYWQNAPIKSDPIKPYFDSKMRKVKQEHF